MKASLKGKYETDKSGAAANVAFFASDVKFRASLTDATFAAGPSLNGLVLAVEKPGSFIVDYNVPKQDLRFQFMNSVRVVGKPLNLNYIHMRGDNRTILDGTLVLDSANKVSANHVLGSRNGKFKYSYLHGGATTFEPSYDLAKNSWDFAVAQRVYDDVFRASYQTSSKLLGLEWSRSSKINGSFKERREHLKQLHAESQRLLRETRDAAFKPIPLVQKPISSVLEKIRKRKLEVSQKCSSTGDYKVLKVATEESIASQAGKGNSANEVCIDGSNDKEEHSSCGNVSSGMDVDEEPKQTFRAPIDYTQDLFSDNQTTSDKDGLPNDDSKSPLEEVFAPSVLAMNLKLDSAPPDDVSSDEEDYNDKENIAPHSSEVADVPSSPIGDPVKAFVDDEAEEEDDSDHDLHRFEDSDDDEDDGDAAELNDMIATGYEERPVDNERRNELHQKWLEQQDASGTEKLMQKLKFGSKQKETELVKEKDADVQEDEEFGEENAEDEEFGNEDADDSAPANAVRMNLRELKQMMPLLYTDNDDVYLSSDDDETEKRLSKQCLSEKAEMQATFLSPAEDESSREVFGHIKKLNIAPDTKKAKVPSFPNMLLAGGDRSISSKSSFLGRGPSHSLPSSNKHGLSTVRSFILVQGDSNSRSSMSEDSSDMVQREILPKKTTAAKLSKSKAKFGTQTLSPDAVSTEAVANTETLAEADAQKDRSAGAGAWADALAVPAPAGSSLLTILRQPSLPSKRCTRGITVDQIESVLASFENGRKSMRANGQVYRRT